MLKPRKLETGEALQKQAEELGVSMNALYNLTTGILDEPELQRRVIEALRSQREQSLWVIALISACASALSAAAALIAVLSQ